MSVVKREAGHLPLQKGPVRSCELTQLMAGSAVSTYLDTVGASAIDRKEFSTLRCACSSKPSSRRYSLGNDVYFLLAQYAKHSG